MKELSIGAKQALIRIALRDTMRPSMDGYAWCGKFGAQLVKAGYAIDTKCREWGFKCYEATETGKELGLKLFEETKKTS